MRDCLRATWAIVHEARSDNLTGEAAKAAYYFFLSLWPLLLGLFAFTGIFGGQPAFDWIMGWITGVLPSGPTRFLEEFVREITAEERPEILSLGIVLTIWSGSSIFVSLADGLNRMYDIDEGRPWWKRRLIAMALLLCASVLLAMGATFVLVGEELLDQLGLGAAWNVMRWPLAFLMLTALTWLIYYHLPNRKQRMSIRYVTIGALVGTGLWLVVTTGFRIYVANWGELRPHVRARGRRPRAPDLALPDSAVDPVRGRGGRVAGAGRAPETQGMNDHPTGAAAPTRTERRARVAETIIIPQEHGPYHVKGDFRIVLSDGTELEGGGETWLCRCGLSKTKPFCDSTHKGGFVCDNAEMVARSGG